MKHTNAHAAQGYARYWQGRMAFQKMSAFWTSAFTSACSFAKHRPHYDPPKNPTASVTLSPIKRFAGLAAEEIRKKMAKHGSMRALHLMTKRDPKSKHFYAWQDYTEHSAKIKAIFCRVKEIHAEYELQHAFEHWRHLRHFRQWKHAKQHRFFDDVMHLSSLLHATACMKLRRDNNFDNLIEFSPNDPECNPPSSDIHLPSTTFYELHGSFFTLARHCAVFDKERHERYCMFMKLGVIHGVSPAERFKLTKVSFLQT